MPRDKKQLLQGAGDDLSLSGQQQSIALFQGTNFDSPKVFYSSSSWRGDAGSNSESEDAAGATFAVDPELSAGSARKSKTIDIVLTSENSRANYESYSHDVATNLQPSTSEQVKSSQLSDFGNSRVLGLLNAGFIKDDESEKSSAELSVEGSIGEKAQSRMRETEACTELTSDGTCDVGETSTPVMTSAQSEEPPGDSKFRFRNFFRRTRDDASLGQENFFIRRLRGTRSNTQS